MARSIALRTPTPRNSTDPQCEQWGEYTPYSTAIPTPVPAAAAESARGSHGFGLPVTAQVRTAGFAGGFDLFVGPYIGLRNLDVLSGAGNLALVTLGESLVHTLDYTCGKLEPYEALVDSDVCRRALLRAGCGDPYICPARRQGTCPEEYRSRHRRRTDYRNPRCQG